VKRALQLLARVAGATLLTLLLLEAVLQLGAVVVRMTGRETPVPLEAGAGVTRLLALGDSNTYGLYLEREQAYPALLAARWNRDLPGSLQVVNLGYPGNNSSVILRDLAANLREHRPQIVTIMVGVNDFWTIPVETAGDSSAGAGLGAALRSRSRVYKLGYMLWRSVAGPLKDTTVVRTEDPSARRLDRNLDRIAEIVEQHEARLLVLTYPYGELQNHCNRRLRGFAERAGLALVDTTDAYASRCGSTHCEELLFFDNHPSAAGHEMIARLLDQALR